MAHEIRGVAGNLGAVELSKKLAFLEKSCKQAVSSFDEPDLVATCKNELQALISAIRFSLCASAGHADAGLPVPGEAEQPPLALFAELTQRVVHADSDTNDFVTANEALLRPWFPGDRWEVFNRQLAGYDFGAAQPLLDELLQSLSQGRNLSKSEP